MPGDVHMSKNMTTAQADATQAKVDMKANLLRAARERAQKQKEKLLAQERRRREAAKLAKSEKSARSFFKKS